jgi:hypothetical protein
MTSMVEPRTAAQRMVTDSQIKTLENFKVALRAISRRDNEGFRWAISHGVDLLNLTHQDIAEAFSISRPSVTRWINGQNSPHPAIRPMIYEWLAAKSEEKAKQEHLLLEVAA